MVPDGRIHDIPNRLLILAGVKIVPKSFALPDEGMAQIHQGFLHRGLLHGHRTDYKKPAHVWRACKCQAAGFIRKNIGIRHSVDHPDMWRSPHVTRVVWFVYPLCRVKFKCIKVDLWRGQMKSSPCGRWSKGLKAHKPRQNYNPPLRSKKAPPVGSAFWFGVRDRGIRRPFSSARCACGHWDPDASCAGGSTSASLPPVHHPGSRPASAPASCGSAG